jgi:hypothetical protein
MEEVHGGRKLFASWQQAKKRQQGTGDKMHPSKACPQGSNSSKQVSLSTSPPTQSSLFEF